MVFLEKQMRNPRFGDHPRIQTGRAAAPPADFPGRGVHFFEACASPSASVRSARRREGKRMADVVTWSALLQSITAVVSIINLVIALINLFHNITKK